MGAASVPCVLDRDSLVCRGSNHPGRGPDNLGLLDRGGSNPPRIIGPGVTATGGSNHPSIPELGDDLYLGDDPYPDLGENWSMHAGGGGSGADLNTTSCEM